MLGTSQTDRRLEEAENIQGLLNLTAQNFIDVSTKAAPLDSKDMEERTRHYGLQSMKVESKAGFLFAMPAPALDKPDVAAVAAVLAAAGGRTPSVQQAQSCARELQALREFQVKGSRELVLSVDQL